MRIGIDLMGGDNSPTVLFEAVKQAAIQRGNAHSLLVLATKSVVHQLKNDFLSTQNPFPHAKIEFRAVSEMIGMSDEPIGAIRRKKEASIVVGTRLLKKKFIDAFVTTGNTGALIASATLSLPKLPGIKRPALLALLPTERNPVAVIDVGGNVSCKANHLVQFALMGAAYQRCARGLATPIVGLLNIGVESKKGTTEVRQAYEILRHQQKEMLHFLGNIEGRDVFKGEIDVLVTDGFTGNVLLKTSEGASGFIFGALEGSPEAAKIQSSLAILKKKFDYSEYPGAIVCGLDGIVVKCHGDSSPQALLSGILGAFDLVEKDVIGHLKQQLSAMHQSE